MSLVLAQETSKWQAPFSRLYWKKKGSHQSPVGLAGSPTASYCNRPKGFASTSCIGSAAAGGFCELRLGNLLQNPCFLLKPSLSCTWEEDGCCQLLDKHWPCLGCSSPGQVVLPAHHSPPALLWEVPTKQEPGPFGHLIISVCRQHCSSSLGDFAVGVCDFSFSMPLTLRGSSLPAALHPALFQKGLFSGKNKSCHPLPEPRDVHFAVAFTTGLWFWLLLN